MGVLLTDDEMIRQAARRDRWQISIDARIERLRCLQILDWALRAAESCGDGPEVIGRLITVKRQIQRD